MSGGGLRVAPHGYIKVVLDRGGVRSSGAIGVSASARSAPLEVGVAMHCGNSREVCKGSFRRGSAVCVRACMYTCKITTQLTFSQPVHTGDIQFSIYTHIHIRTYTHWAEFSTENTMCM